MFEFIVFIFFCGLLVVAIQDSIQKRKDKKENREFNEKYPDYNKTTIENAKLKINKSVGQVQSGIRKNETGRAQGSTAFCPYCGERVPAGSKTCHGCGRKIDD